MSAFLVNKDTLDLMATAATQRDGSSAGLHVYLDDDIAPPQFLQLHQNGGARYVDVRPGDEDTLVRELFAANVESIAARYPGDWESMVNWTPCDDWTPILDVDHATILGAIACYEYQSCELTRWRYSFAHAFTTALRNKVCRAIAGDSWEYEKPEGAAKVISLMSIIK